MTRRAPALATPRAALATTIALAALLGGLALAAQEAPTPAPSAPPAPAAPPAGAKPRAVAPPGSPNLVVVTMDTTRADHLGCYGYQRPTTPQIDVFAAESILFERCYAVVPHTTPSHASLFTGVYPYEHGVLACSFRADEKVQEQRAFSPSPRLRLYSQILADAGWHNGGFVTAATTKKITGLGAGYSAWSEPEEEVRAGEEALADALAWLETVPEPFFLWLHLFDAHDPPRQKHLRYVKELAADDALLQHMTERRISVTGRGGKGAAAGSRELVLYDAGLRMIDDHFRDLRAKLAAKGVWERTTVVVTGDHGEGLGQHGEKNHGPVWEEQIRVPFLLRVPGRAAERVETMVSTIDVLPTAIQLTPGLPAEEFLAQARGTNALAEDFMQRPLFSMSPPRRGDLALTTGRWRALHRKGGDHALYDLENDPFELKNVLKENGELFAKLDQQLQQLLSEQKKRHAWYYDGKAPPADDLTPEERERLRKELEAIGYAEGGEEGDDEGDGG